MKQAAVRVCNIRFGDDELSSLKITFGVATRLDEDEYEAIAVVKCRYFSRNLKGAGHDGAQALFTLPLIVHGYLQGMESKGYSIFWLEPGDLHHPGFWGVQSLTLPD